MERTIHIGPATMQVLFAVLAIIAITSSAAKAQPRYRIEAAEVYVKMDFWKAPSSQSAEAWHFDPNNNGLWTQLPNKAGTPTAPPRAQFRVMDLFRHDLMPDNHVWFVGVESIRVVTGEPGNFADVSLYPQYTEMIDRMVFAADPAGVDGGPYDPCGERIWPIATGSELTHYMLHPHSGWAGGYGMRLLKEGLLESTAWLWKNPNNVEQADVYIEFTLMFDMDDVPEQPLRSHRKVKVSWISAAGGCGYTFCLAQGQETAVKVGTPFAILDGNYTAILVAVPHVIDHTATLQLYMKVNNQNTLLIDTSINNSNNHHTTHKCEPDGGLHAWHNHSSGPVGHLPVGGLSAWRGVIELNGNAAIFTAASFNIPTHATADPTNHRALYMVFWHGTIDQGGGA